MSVLSSINNIAEGEDFNVTVVNRPHNDLVTRDDELLSLIGGTSGQQPSGYFSKLHVQGLNSTQVKIFEDSSVSSDDNTIVMTAGSDITITITTSGVNGLDVQPETSSTWYYIWMIRAAGSGTEAGLLSTSSTAPTMPFGYTIKRLIGVVYNNSSSNLIEFNQFNNKVHYPSYNLVLNAGSATGWTSISLAAFLPPTICTQVQLWTIAANNANTGPSATLSYLGPKSGYTFTIHYANLDVGDNQIINNAMVVLPLWEPTTPVIYYRCSSSLHDFTVYVQGFELDI